VTTREDIRRQLADALMELWREDAGDLGDPIEVTGAGDVATQYADALLPVVTRAAAEAYGHGRDDETTDVHSSQESAARRWWETP
jgi:hypothetical protein